MSPGTLIVVKKETEFLSISTRDSYIDLHEHQLAIIIAKPEESDDFLAVFSPNHGRGYVRAAGVEVVKE